MHGRALYIGAPYCLADAATPSSEIPALFERSGRNSGNLLIGYSLRSQLDCAVESVSPEHPPRHRDYDFIAIAAANFLFSGFDFGSYADLIEQTDLPCLMVGLGAQAPRAGGMPDIKPGTQRFVRAIAARTDRIGVRGAFTAEVLNCLGIKNVEITGCPSFYLRKPAQIRAAFAAHANAGEGVSLNGSRNVISHSSQPDKMKAIERRIYELCIGGKSQFVLQSEAEEMRILASEDDVETAELAGKIIDSIGLTGLSREAVRDAIRAKFKIYFNIEAWSNSVRAFSFSAGTRFHGNLIALLSGVPAHVISHDSRTQELCEFADIPHTRVEDLAEDFTIEDLRRVTNIDKFVRRQAMNYSAYVRFLDRNGIRHTLADREPYASVA
jgi:polysaccharide pyruvyl transferase WcaK-like protein